LTCGQDDDIIRRVQKRKVEMITVKYFENLQDFRENRRSVVVLKDEKAYTIWKRRIPEQFIYHIIFG